MGKYEGKNVFSDRTRRAFFRIARLQTVAAISGARPLVARGGSVAFLESLVLGGGTIWIDYPLEKYFHTITTRISVDQKISSTLS